MRGSSPLTRGKPRHRMDRRDPVGLIPAHAGKTSLHYTLRTMYRAHPRSRGENEGSDEALLDGGGSSPLTRGKRKGLDFPPKSLGLIPAHAGKTRTRSARAPSNRAHPRSRGENGPVGALHHFPAGSSPLTRGKPQEQRAPPEQVGLIPAHAGKTLGIIGGPPRPRAHPRSRGENGNEGGCVFHGQGSSPLTRGKHERCQADLQSVGLIPAHAGKTSSTCTIYSTTRAHPRSRGENLLHRSVSFMVLGSSPLTRGKRYASSMFATTNGLIPAHAGKTTPPSTNSEPLRAHPRSRGENRTFASGQSSETGSSPLTRGKRRRLQLARQLPGLIPAHAGKTGRWGRFIISPRAHPRSRGENL